MIASGASIGMMFRTPASHTAVDAYATSFIAWMTLGVDLNVGASLSITMAAMYTPAIASAYCTIACTMPCAIPYRYVPSSGAPTPTIDRPMNDAAAGMAARIAM